MEARNLRPARHIAAVLALLAPAAVVAVTASASHQPAKNGCTSATVVRGTLTSPLLDFQQVSASPEISFKLWWEIESLDPYARDLMTVDYSLDGGATWTSAGPTLNAGIPTPSLRRSDVPVSNVGTQTAPAWQPHAVALPAEAQRKNTVRVRFTFDSVDTAANGFRGWGIDDVARGSSGETLPETFEGDTSGWTFQPLWHVQSNAQNVFVASPDINPDLVTLGAGDDGRLPADDDAGQGHSRYAWFGGADTGTYCGPEALQHPAPPPATEEPPPPPPPPPRDDPPLFPSGTPTGRTISDLPRPRTGQTVNIGRVRGTVLVRFPAEEGARASQVESQAEKGFVPLDGSAQVPVGSTIDTSKGVLRLQSGSNSTGSRTQTATFFLGMFELRQARSRRPVTEMVLKGGSFRRTCRASSSASDGNAVTSRHRRGRRVRRGSRVRRLWGRGRGRYRTRGRYSSATVRGTKWVVEERCNGTFTRLARRPRNSRVDVRDFVRRRTVRLRSGESYFAPRGRIRDARISLSPRAIAPGGATTVTGRGWGSRRLVTLRVLADGDGSRARLVRVRASRRGGFRKRVRLPAGAGTGRYTVQACTSRCRAQSTAPLSVRAP